MQLLLSVGVIACCMFMGGKFRKMSGDHEGCSLGEEEVGIGGSLAGGGGVVGPLKKGPWTSTEDAILIDYVTKHGEGNWNAVMKHSGLSRCGKSCRLRWANHLRPDLKKGAFTPDEEERIIELHSRMGNKWARMASEVRAFVHMFYVLVRSVFIVFALTIFNLEIHENYVIVKPEFHYLVPFSVLMCCQSNESK